MTPLWLGDDGELDAKEMSLALGRPVRSARLGQPMSGKNGGLSGRFDDVYVDDEEVPRFVLKRTGGASAKTLGTCREGLFYARFSKRLGDLVPLAYRAFADEGTGSSEVLMEKIEGCVPAGVDFGNGNPNNWGHSLPGARAYETTKRCFEAYAKLHSRFWRDKSLLDCHWLRGADWLQGRGQDDWEAAQQLAKSAWEDREQNDVIWDRHVVECLDASFKKVDWQTFQNDLTERPFALVHGDAHPHNILKVEDKLLFIDFEMVGLGSPLQDLGQFIISHMTPQDRRTHEKDLIRHYHTHLNTHLTKEHLSEEHLSFEVLFDEYLRGGIGRWLWFTPYLAKVCPTDMGQFFHDQLKAALHDHFPDNPNDVPMPRV